MSADIAIKVEHLSKHYHIYDRPQDRLKEALVPRLQRLLGRTPTTYAREFRALDDVSFEVLKGETVGIIGRNGSGKSTLLQMICGTLTPASGRVEIRGRVAALLELGSGFNLEFTGRDNVYLNGAVLGLTTEEIDARFDAIAEFAEIGEFIDQPVKTYSSGMVVRLAFAVSVSVEPDVLVVDEALAVGDMAFQQKCLQRLTDLREMGTTILLVTHDIMLTRNYCGRVVYLNAGRLRAIGDAETVGEAYLKDLFATRASGPGAAASVEWKQTEGKLRFGSQGGAIGGCDIVGDRSAGPVFEPGETLTVRVEAEIGPDIRTPEIIVQLRDARGYVLYGLPTTPDDLRVERRDDRLAVTASLEFVNDLGPGEYALSLGLVDRHGESLSTLLDKIVAAASFSVVPRSQPRFHGSVDLHGRWRPPHSA